MRLRVGAASSRAVDAAALVLRRDKCQRRERSRRLGHSAPRRLLGLVETSECLPIIYEPARYTPPVAWGALGQRALLALERAVQQLAAAGIGIKPAYCFTDAVAPHNDFFRVGFGEEKMPAALEAFAAFVEKRKDAWRRGMRASAKQERRSRPHPGSPRLRTTTGEGTPRTRPT